MVPAGRRAATRSGCAASGQMGLDLTEGPWSSGPSNVPAFLVKLCTLLSDP